MTYVDLDPFLFNFLPFDAKRDEIEARSVHISAKYYNGTVLTIMLIEVQLASRYSL